MEELTPRDIRRLRGALGLTQEQFANLVHAHPGTVSRWETGDRKPDPWQLGILRELQKVARDKPQAADEAQRLLAAGFIGGALGVLLGALVVGVAVALSDDGKKEGS